MSDIVFILGAGASKDAGVPLMAEFLDVAEREWRLKHVEGRNASFKDVFDALSQLSCVHSKSTLDIENVESVFSAFEMGLTLLISGEWRDGFNALDIRLKRPGLDPRREGISTWGGEPLNGQTILIIGEGNSVNFNPASVSPITVDPSSNSSMLARDSPVRTLSVHLLRGPLPT